MLAINTENLRKVYKDKRCGIINALDGVSIKVEECEIYGLLGRNGAGKTTFIKILLNICNQDYGTAKIFEQQVSNPKTRQIVSYLPEDHQLPDYHTPKSLLEFYGNLHKMNRKNLRSKIDEVINITGLKDWTNTKIKVFSKGMKQRLGFAQAILNDSKILFLDEPTDGVDPVGRKEIRDLILDMQKKSKTIFINSHILSEVELVCNRVGILENGKLLKEGSVKELTKIPLTYEIMLSALPDDLISTLKNYVSSFKLLSGGIEVVVKDKKDVDILIDIIRNKGISINSFSEKKVTLENIFIETVVPEIATDK